MGEHSSLKFTYYDLLKLIGASLMMFLALVLGVKEAGEPSSIIQVDYLAETSTHEIALPAIEHPSAQTPLSDSAPGTRLSPLDRLCSPSPELCKKVIYSGNLSEPEQLYYTKEYLDIISFLQTELQSNHSITATLKQLILNSEAGRRRGGATRNRITINLASLGALQEYRGVLTHEFGHILDLGVLQGLSPRKDSNYTEFGQKKFSIDDPSLEYYRYSRETEKIRLANVTKSDFCSGYGMTNPFEDFAECHNLYLNNALLFRKMAEESLIMKNKYNFFANLFVHKTLQEHEQELLYPGWRPRDTTLI